MTNEKQSNLWSEWYEGFRREIPDLRDVGLILYYLY
jgi:hypothetical protein